MTKAYDSFWCYLLCLNILNFRRYPRNSTDFFNAPLREDSGPFASLKKQTETLFRLICCERKILFRLKKTNWKRRIIREVNMASGTNYERAVCLQPCQATLPGTQANRPEVHVVSYSANSPVESTTHGLYLYTYGIWPVLLSLLSY